ncbi:hypothetical protein [Pseudalkalibacillus berkeleyi]|uniref:Uncharacterized protein n=1 Tax=Pseudalkalibacillus berkeleyi TaxID=1069813 RepID=A0ABS9H160_9BACL|nr:hypothetical protein [Pseudalkalibacillus berkeleyi]MCF6137821.1 hypothetical protein [Pseudalkalibacillus berkeleyi]
MSKENFKHFNFVGFSLIVCGFVFLFFSVDFGTSIAEFWLISKGGADTALYHIVIQSYINSFLISGTIFLVAGIMMVTLCYYQLHTKGLNK